MDHVQTESELEELLSAASQVILGGRDVRSDAEQVSQIVQDILDSYRHQGGINYASGANLPSQQHIVNIMHTLRMILFPGYYDHGAIEETTLPYTTGERIAWVCKHLSEEINKCLCFECRECDRCEQLTECLPRARGITLDLLQAIPDIRAMLRLDVQAAVDGDPATHSADEVILAYPSLAAITVHRVAHFMYQRQVPLLPRIMSEDIHHRTGIDIHPGAIIGHSFFIDHGTGVVIGETTEIGHRVKLYQGVTLGALSVSREMRGHKRHPTIEDDVTIYAGATILGGDTVIGQGSVIGGNVWLVTSVPPYSKVYNERAVNEPVVASYESTVTLDHPSQKNINREQKLMYYI
jgi:serine O-acetyltransferase